MTSSEHDDSTDRSVLADALDDAVASVGVALSMVRVAAFWIAVVLPFVAVALLVTGIDSPTEWRMFGALVVCNVVSLYVGNPHAEP